MSQTITKDLIQKDLQTLWHPYTQMKDFEQTPPILIERAEGIKLFDSNGNYYYDTIASWWCNVHGHNHPHINQAIKNQVDKMSHIMFSGLTHEPAIRLAERLVKLAPESLSRVFYSDNGSTAVEVAMKMSLQYWQLQGHPQKTHFVHLENGYHGDTIGTMSVSGVTAFKKVFHPLLFPASEIPTPSSPEQEKISLEAAKTLFQNKHNEIAAIIVEPLLMGAGGMIVYSESYLKELHALAEKYKIHFIADEVATGFGRTGTMFACEKAGISPDFLCLSKGITSGYLPIAATLTSATIYEAFYDDYESGKTFFHGHTFTANPLACAAANATLDIFESEETLEKMSNLIPIFQKKLAKFNALPCVSNIRSIGLVGAFDLVQDKKTEKRLGYEVYQRGLEKHLMLRPLGNVVYFFLPLCVTADEIDEILGLAYGVLLEI